MTARSRRHARMDATRVARRPILSAGAKAHARLMSVLSTGSPDPDDPRPTPDEPASPAVARAGAGADAATAATDRSAGSPPPVSAVPHEGLVGQPDQPLRGRPATGKRRPVSRGAHGSPSRRRAGRGRRRDVPRQRSAILGGRADDGRRAAGAAWNAGPARSRTGRRRGLSQAEVAFLIILAGWCCLPPRIGCPEHSPGRPNCKPVAAETTDWLTIRGTQRGCIAWSVPSDTCVPGSRSPCRGSPPTPAALVEQLPDDGRHLVPLHQERVVALVRRDLAVGGLDAGR